MAVLNALNTRQPDSTSLISTEARLDRRPLSRTAPATTLPSSSSSEAFISCNCALSARSPLSFNRRSRRLSGSVANRAMSSQIWRSVMALALLAISAALALPSSTVSASRPCNCSIRRKSVSLAPRRIIPTARLALACRRPSASVRRTSRSTRLRRALSARPSPARASSADSTLNLASTRSGSTSSRKSPCRRLRRAVSSSRCLARTKRRATLRSSASTLASTSASTPPSPLNASSFPMPVARSWRRCPKWSSSRSSADSRSNRVRALPSMGTSTRMA